MLTKGRRGSLEEGDLHDAKRPSGDKETIEGTENPHPEPSLAEINEGDASGNTNVSSEYFKGKPNIKRRTCAAEVSISSSTT